MRLLSLLTALALLSACETPKQPYTEEPEVEEPKAVAPWFDHRVMEPVIGATYYTKLCSRTSSYQNMSKDYKIPSRLFITKDAADACDAEIGANEGTEGRICESGTVAMLYDSLPVRLTVCSSPEWYPVWCQVQILKGPNAGKTGVFPSDCMTGEAPED